MRIILSSFIAALIGLPAMSAQADGEATFKAICANCHANGVANAPRVGDQKKWAPLIREGQIGLTAEGYVGVRGMPPRGGKPDLSLEEFANAVVYMANQSAAKWSPPDAKLLATIQLEVIKREKALAKKAKR